MAKNFIQGIHKGGLHESLGVPQGQKIPASMIRSHLHDSGLVGKQARLAMTLKGLRPKKKKKVRRK